ncbi:MAG: damage-control phosphatase ARMT1 family protein [Bacteroidales bacterium]
MVDERCEECFLKTYRRLFRKFNVDESQQRSFLVFFNSLMERQSNFSSPEVQLKLNRKFCQIIGVVDPFVQEKDDSNRIALGLYKEWKPKVGQSHNRFELALRLAIAGNIMDYGANSAFNIEKTIERVLKADFAIDQSKLLEERISNAKRILYLGDNAGEILFDRLFIETINHDNVTYAVKSAPILNDVTMKDANDSGINRVVKVISNGYDAPSTILNHCSDEFLDIYKSADLIVSKGQGNLEGLLDVSDRRIFFALMVKCNVIAERLKVEKGSFIVHSTN